MLPVLCEGSTLYPSNCSNRRRGTTPVCSSRVARIRCARMCWNCCSAFAIARACNACRRCNSRRPYPNSNVNVCSIRPPPWALNRWAPTAGRCSARRAPRRGLAPYYNPLDARVQQAMQRVVEELAPALRRSIRPSPASACNSVPKRSRCCPTIKAAATNARFSPFSSKRACRLAPSSPVIRSGEPKRRKRFAPRAALAWLNWRAQKIADFYRQLQQTVEQHHPGGKLFVLPGELLASRPIQFALRPALPAQEQAAAAFPCSVSIRASSPPIARLCCRCRSASRDFVGLSTAYQAWGQVPISPRSSPALPIPRKLPSSRRRSPCPRSIKSVPSAQSKRGSGSCRNSFPPMPSIASASCMQSQPATRDC